MLASALSRMLLQYAFWRHRPSVLFYLAATALCAAQHRSITRGAVAALRLVIVYSILSFKRFCTVSAAFDRLRFGCLSTVFSMKRASCALKTRFFFWPRGADGHRIE